MSLINKLKQMIAGDEESSAETDANQLRLAKAVLLVEVARADYVEDAAERAVVVKQLQEQCELGEGEAVALLAEAERSAESDVSLHRHLDALNERFGPEQKREVMRSLWSVAFADGELHPHEEYLLRKLADLLHVPHSDFIRTKLAVAPES